MAYQFADQGQNVTLETNATGELICRMSDGTNKFSDIVNEVFQKSYDLDEMSKWDLTSAEQVNRILDALDIGSQVSSFMMKSWRLGASTFYVNEKADYLDLPASRFSRTLLLEARNGGLTYERMKALLADEISFEMLSAKRRGAQGPALKIGARLISETKTLLENDFLIPKMG